MLSIVIPVYNFNIVELVLTLHKQCIECNIPFEIQIIDDCSKAEFKTINSAVSKLTNVNYTELEQNIGRSKIRNLLAQQARFEYLLFMDCDAEVPSENYIKNYINNCIGNVIICGGTAYSLTPPPQQELLRWNYGIEREQRSAENRNKKPNACFSTFNFVISKSIFLQITFNENITQYGHEDTLFGFELKKRNYTIIHIDNQLIHLGLDNNMEFIRKTKVAIHSLIDLYNSPTIDPAFFEDIRLLSMYSKITFLGLRQIVAWIYTLFAKKIERSLYQNTPSVQLFDLMKLGYICTLKSKN